MGGEESVGNMLFISASKIRYSMFDIYIYIYLHFIIQRKTIKIHNIKIQLYCVL